MKQLLSRADWIYFVGYQVTQNSHCKTAIFVTAEKRRPAQSLASVGDDSVIVDHEDAGLFAHFRRHAVCLPKKRDAMLARWYVQTRRIHPKGCIDRAKLHTYDFMPMMRQESLRTGRALNNELLDHVNDEACFVRRNRCAHSTNKGPHVLAGRMTEKKQLRRGDVLGPR